MTKLNQITEVQFKGGRIVFDTPRQIKDLKIFLCTMDLEDVVLVYKEVQNLTLTEAVRKALDSQTGQQTITAIDSNGQDYIQEGTEWIPQPINWTGQWRTSTEQKVEMMKDTDGIYCFQGVVKHYIDKEGNFANPQLGRLVQRRRSLEEKW